MSKEVVHLGKSNGFEFEITRCPKKNPDKYGAFFYTVKIFTTYVSPKYGPKRDYSIPSWKFNEFKLAMADANEVITGLNNGAPAQAVVNAATQTTTSEISDDCPY